MRETKQIKQKKCAENFFNSEVGARQDNVIVKSTEMLVVWIWPGQFQCFYGLHTLGIGLSFSANTWFALLFSHFPGAVRVAGEGHSPFLFFFMIFLCVFLWHFFKFLLFSHFPGAVRVAGGGHSPSRPRGIPQSASSRLPMPPPALHQTSSKKSSDTTLKSPFFCDGTR